MANRDGPPVDIFLSHSGSQKGFAKDLHDSLSSLTYSVFFDQEVHSLPPGENFRRPIDILSAVKTCKLAVVVLSDAFLTSEWPMIELCTFADRHRSDTASEFTLLPLFLELLPEHLKDEEKRSVWREEWQRLAQRDSNSRIDVAQWEVVVTKVLPSLNGIIRRSPKEEGEMSYINVVVDAIERILPPRNLEYGSDPDNRGKKYVGRERLGKIILDKFDDLDRETEHAGNNEFQKASSSSISCASSSVNVVAKVSIVGMYGLPGSGKTTVCDFLRHYLLDDDPLFRGEAAYFKFPTELSDGIDDSEESEFAKLFSKIVPVHSTVPSTDPDKMYSYLRCGRVPSNGAQKMFLMLDNISASNIAACMTMLNAILASAILGFGSRVMLVSRSDRLLKGLLEELAEQYPRHGYAIMEVPCLTEEEAKDIIKNRCRSVKEHIVAAFLRKSTFLSYSLKSMYIPLVFEQIGNYLRDTGDCDALERLWKNVNMAKKGSLKKLLQMNFGRLEKHLRHLFFDIALFVIQAGYSKFHDHAIPILSRMHNMTDVDIEMQIEELEKRSWLSLIDVKGARRLRVHDIYVDFARSIPGNMARYINERSSLASMTDASAHRLSLVDHSSHARKCRDQVPDGRYAFRRNSKYLDARTINIGIAPAASGQEMQTRFLHLELGSSAKALIVRNRFPNQYSKCVLGLSGNLSKLVCLEMENVWQVEISPSEGALDLSNLTRLALRNDNAKEIRMITCTSQEGRGPMELINNAVDFIANELQKGAESVKRLWNPRLAWDECSYSGRTHNPLLRNLMAGATEMTGLRELVLVNAGITKLDGIGHLCPQLEALEVWNDFEHEEAMSVSIIGGAPKLKRLAAGPFPPNCSLEGAFNYFRMLSLMRHRGYYYRQANAPNRSSSKLILELDECPELKQMCVNGSFFGHVQMAGRLPANVSDLVVVNDRGNVDYSSTMPITSYLQQLSQLGRLELSCTKVERLEFSEEQYCLFPKLEQLVIQGCAHLCHLSLHLNCLPILLRLTVQRCHGLERIELVDKHHPPASTSCSRSLRCLELIDLPNLKSDGPLPSTSCRIGFTLRTVTVRNCPRFEINSGILEASEIIELGETCMPTPQQLHDQSSPTSASSLVSVNVNQLKFENSRFQRLQFLTLEKVTGLIEIQGIEHLGTLHEVTLLSIPDLIRVGGKSWPRSIREIWVSHCAKLQRIPPVQETPTFFRLRCNECNDLKEVKVIGKVMNVEFIGCRSMESFPLEDAKEELKKRREEYPEIWAWHCRVRVAGSKFAEEEKMLKWLECSEFGSPLFEAAVGALMWDYRPSSSDKKSVSVDDILDKIGSKLPTTTTITNNDLKYLGNLFSSQHSDPFLTLGEKSLLFGFPNDDTRFFQEWLLSKFPQLS